MDSRKQIIIWLATGCFLIALMVVVGGITRLTYSGLSMVEWNLVMGSIPPLSEQDWLDTFNKYKQTPEFRIKNHDFSLEEFKSIFWWEYIHRMLGRLIGLVFIVPFLYFLFKKKLDAPLIKKLFIVFALGCFQAFLGWFMVKSGLVKDPQVSHYRLAGHLVTAFILFGFIFWIMLEIIFRKAGKEVTHTRRLRKYTVALLFITFIQVTYGAFVSGLKAGRIYNTFPKMGDQWIPDTVGFAYQKAGLISFLENMGSVQFIHRYIAFIIFFLVIYIWSISRKISLSSHQRMGLSLVLSILTAQILLGIFTLLFAVPVVLAIFHQIGALLLVTAIIYFWFHLRKTTI